MTGVRGLRLALAGLWLLDAALQYQPFMFTGEFARTLPVGWAARLVGDDPVVFNLVFATVQLLLAAGIAWRRTLRAALAASVVWSAAVWWLGEGFGGVFTGIASPVNGAPGAVLLYALLAVLLWPRDSAADTADAPFPAALAIGARPARLVWLVLFALLGSFALWPANMSPGGLPGMIAGMGDGEPGWLASLEYHTAALIGLRGPDISAALALILYAVAVGVYVSPPRVTRVFLIATIALAAVIWVFGEAFGAIFAGQGTDPNTGPLLALLALAYWPSRVPAVPRVAVPRASDAPS